MKSVSRAQESILLALAIFGLIVPNGIFLYIRQHNERKRHEIGRSVYG
jgi:hypothetical protein